MKQAFVRFTMQRHDRSLGLLLRTWDRRRCRSLLIHTTSATCRNAGYVSFYKSQLNLRSNVGATNETSEKKRDRQKSKRSKYGSRSSNNKNNLQLPRPLQKAIRRMGRKPYSEPPKPAKNYEHIFPPTKLDVEISCHPGLEGVLSQELKSLRIDHTINDKRNVARLKAPSIDSILLCHLHLGSASQVLLNCGPPFTARGFPELERKVERLPWRKLLTEKTIVNVKIGLTYKSKLLHTTAIRDRIKGSIYKSMGRDSPTNDEVDDADTVNIHVRVIRDQFYLSMATSTTPLHTRGYRLEPGKAPLREDLAYAMIYSAGWTPRNLSRKLFDGFLDPFCGSGTLAIEAACIAKGLPPGRLRSAPLSGTTLLDSQRWPKLVNEAIALSVQKKDQIPISCSDRNTGAVTRAKANIQRAGIPFAIDVHECAYKSHPWLDKLDGEESIPQQLLLASNLPFGKRTRTPSKESNVPPLLPLYQSIAGVLKSYRTEGRTCTAAILTDDNSYIRRSGLDGKLQLNFNNGGIPVTAWLVK